LSPSVQAAIAEASRRVAAAEDEERAARQRQNAHRIQELQNELMRHCATVDEKITSFFARLRHD
jgi:hypothetical protein